MRLYLVRHGESLDALDGLHQRSDSPLSDEGMRQAEQIAKRLESIKIDKVFSSTLLRARQTAEIIVKDRRVEIDYNDLIVELRKPSILVGKKKDDENIKGLKDFMKKNFGTEHRHSDEENFSDLKERVRRFIGVLEKEESESVLVVTHGYLAKFLFGMIAFGEKFNWNLAMGLFALLKMSNTGLTIFNLEAGNWKLITWNDIAHLGE